MSDPAERSIEHFSSGFMCAESVLLAMSEHLGVVCEILPAIATGLCAGVSRTGRMCGALTGAILSLGLALGRCVPGEPPEPCFLPVQKLVQGFHERFGATDCPALIGLNFALEADRIRFREENVKETKCFTYTREAVRLALALVREAQQGA